MFKMGMESMDWNLSSFLPSFLFELNNCMHQFDFHGHGYDIYGPWKFRGHVHGVVKCTSSRVSSWGCVLE